MLGLSLAGLSDSPQIVALGAHCDDIEIGCGGTLLRLTGQIAGLEVTDVVLTGTADRAAEERAAATAFAGPASVELVQAELPDGRLPAHWLEVKELLEDVARRVPRPGLVLAPSPDDAHQDHRLLGTLARTVWRDALVLHYEIPKWDGDLGRPNVYVPLDPEVLTRKIALLHEHFGSQVGRDWFDTELFTGLARMRGVECRARYAEAFTLAKATLTW